jgi:hypothetical protein
MDIYSDHMVRRYEQSFLPLEHFLYHCRVLKGSRNQA